MTTLMKCTHSCVLIPTESFGERLRNVFSLCEATPVVSTSNSGVNEVCDSTDYRWLDIRNWMNIFRPSKLTTSIQASC